MVLLVAAKFATIAVPFTFKYATDALAGNAERAGRGLAQLGGGRAHRHDASLTAACAC